LPAAPAYSVAPSPKATIGNFAESAEALWADASANSVASFTRPLFEGLENPHLKIQISKDQEFCRTTRDPPAQVVLLLGRCRFVTASIFQFCFVKFCQELSVHLATIPRRATRTAPLALPHHEWLPLENAAQFAAPCEGEDQVLKMTFNLLLAFAEQSTDTFSK
jgi:hypothetical protein